MEQVTGTPAAAAVAAHNRVKSSFRRRGIITAVMSGVTYGNYTAFMTLAMSMGLWVAWYGEDSGFTPFAVAFMLSALGAALTDTCSAVWALLIAAWKGKLGDFGRSFKSKPGVILACAAMIGGPLASTAYVIGLQQAGSIVVPISALCPAIGAILARILFKQPLTPRMLLGIAICFGASALIGMSSMGGDEAHPNMMLGLLFGFGAALGWGIEGCVGGYATSMIDPEISITIREVTNGLSNLLIMVPILAMIGDANGFEIIGRAITDWDSMKYFIIGGFACYWGFMLWYKGNAMCGAALGMACNGMFSFWGPFFCWIWIGLIFGIDGWNMPAVAWVAAVLM
ncbi:MAG: hypothetical protein Q4F72_10905, partial [Desulfovibrionaceae bacterium]|nr:hypothetical protein [Desulfovibrionaceae bacterium]